MIIRDTEGIHWHDNKSGKCLTVGQGEGSIGSFSSWGGDYIAVHYTTVFTILNGKYFIINLSKIPINYLLYVLTIGSTLP